MRYPVRYSYGRGCGSKLNTSSNPEPSRCGQVAKLAVAFGMVVLLAEGFKALPGPGGDNKKCPPPSQRETDAKELGVTLPPLPLHELLSKIDFLSVHSPLTADTKGLISERELALMKPSAVVVNAARGGVVDEKGA